MTLGSLPAACSYVHCGEERTLQWHLTSGFCRDIEQTCVLLGYYAAYRGKPCRPLGSTYRSRLQGPPKMGTIRCPETSVNNYHYRLQNIPEERISHLAVMFIPERTPVRSILRWRHRVFRCSDGNKKIFSTGLGNFTPPWRWRQNWSPNVYKSTHDSCIQCVLSSFSG